MKLFSRVEEILSSAGADGNSTTVEVTGYETVGVALSGGGSTYAAVVTFQGTVDGSNWVNLLAMNPADGSLQTSVTNDSGTYLLSIAGLSGFRLNVSSYSAGNVTGVARRSVGGGALSVADVEISTELSLTELPAVITISDSLAKVDVSRIGALGLGVDDSGKWNPFKTERYDTDDLSPLDSDNAETLAAIALGYFWNSTGAGWDRLASIDDFSADSIAIGAFPRVSAALMGIDDSGTLARFKTGRSDSNYAPADSDSAETLAALALGYFWNSTATAWQRRPSVDITDADSYALGAMDVLGAVGLGYDDSGSFARFKTFRSDSDGYAPSSDNAENLLANALLFGWDGAGWDRLLVDDANRLKVMEDWNSTLQVSETTGDHDWVGTVPADKDWHIMWIWVEWTSNATVGNRQVVCQIRDSGDDVIMEMIPGVTQAASLTYRYLFAPGMADLTAVRDTDYIMTPMPPSIIIPELFDVHIYDQGDISSAAGEDIVVQMMVMDRGRVDT